MAVIEAAGKDASTIVSYSFNSIDALITAIDVAAIVDYLYSVRFKYLGFVIVLKANWENVVVVKNSIVIAKQSAINSIGFTVKY